MLTGRSTDFVSVSKQIFPSLRDCLRGDFWEATDWKFCSDTKQVREVFQTYEVKILPSNRWTDWEERKIYYVKMLLLVAGWALRFFGFDCFLAALGSSHQQLSCHPSSISGLWVFPFPNLLLLWLLDPKEGITFGSSITQQILLCYFTDEQEGLKGGHTDPVKTVPMCTCNIPRAFLSFSSL